MKERPHLICLILDYVSCHELKCTVKKYVEHYKVGGKTLFFSSESRNQKNKKAAFRTGHLGTDFATNKKTITTVFTSER